MGEVYGTERPRRRRGRGLLITLIVFLVIIVVALFVVDRVGRSYAEKVISNKVTDQVAAQKASSGKPQVTIEGVPFLTQVAKGTYKDIKIDLPQFAFPAGDGKTLHMPQLDIDANTVKASVSQITHGGNIVADTVTGTGTVPYADAANLLGQQGIKLAYKNGQIVASGAFKVPQLGQTLQVTATGQVKIVDGKLAVTFSDVTVPGLPDIPLMRSLISSYANNLGLELAIPALPLNLKVQGVQAEADGLKVTFGAHDVAFNGSGV